MLLILLGTRRKSALPKSQSDTARAPVADYYVHEVKIVYLLLQLSWKKMRAKGMGWLGNRGGHERYFSPKIRTFLPKFRVFPQERVSIGTLTGPTSNITASNILRRREIGLCHASPRHSK